MSMKLFRSLAVTLFVTVIAFAPIKLKAQSAEKKAIALLEDVTAKMKSYKTMKLDFTYSMVNKGQKIKETFKGTLAAKGDKYKLNISEQQVFCDGKTAWTYIKDANEVTINDVTGDDESFTPTKFMTSYGSNYKSKLAEDKGNQQVIEMTPIKGRRTLAKVRLTLDKNEKQVKGMQVYDKNGGVFTYNIVRFVTDQPISDSEFTFKASNYPKVEVVDMR